MDENPKEHVLVNSMRAHLPQTSSGNTWTVSVDSDTQANIISEKLPMLHDFLRNALKNDLLQIHVQVNQGDTAPVVWNEREVLKHMVESSEKVRNFVDKLKLNLI